MSSNMMLDGYIVESADDNKNDGGQSTANTATALQPVPILMPEPRPVLPITSSEPEEIAKNEALAMPVPLPTGPTALPIVHSQEGGIIEEKVVEEEKTALTRRSTSSSSSSSTSEGGKEKPTDYENIEFEVKDEEVISHDRILSRDVDALSYFVEEHGSIKPDYFVTMRGAHTERRTRVVRRDGRDHIETYTVTIVDFEFSIDISPLLKKSKPIVYTVADNVPAYRGGMRMAKEANGPTRIESRRLVTGDEQDSQEAWERESEALGRPPWITSPETGLTPNNEEAHIGMANKPLASGRSVEEWLTDYIRSRRVVKDFKVTKSVYGWDTLTLTNSLQELANAAGYSIMHPSGSVSVTFVQSSKCVHVRSPNFVSKIFSSKMYIFLTCLVLVFPFLWLWRRFWPGAGGKWAVVGTAFPIKKWEPVKGTHAGETIEAAQARLGGKPLVQAGEEAQRLRVTPTGVWILRGTHESEWFREWQESILSAVKSNTKTEWLPKMKLRTDAEKMNDIATNLDHL